MRVSSTGATPSHLEQGGAPSSCSPVVAARNVRGVGGLVSLAWGASMQSMPAMRRCACSRAGARLARIWAHFSASRLRAAARRASRYAVHAFAPGGGAVWLQLGSGFTRSVRTSGLGLCYLRVVTYAWNSGTRVAVIRRRARFSPRGLSGTRLSLLAFSRYAWGINLCHVSCNELCHWARDVTAR